MRILILLAMLLTQSDVPTQTPTVETRMREHFSKATQMRAAIVRGDLLGARAGAAWLGHTPWSPSMSEKWRAPLQKLREVATEASTAPNLAIAADGLAQIGVACAGCHLALGGPQLGVDRPVGAASGIRPRMSRHAWAIERMWEGLTAPSEEAWLLGSEALADAPLEAGALGRNPRGEARLMANRVHALGQKAHAAASADRPSTYGQLLAACAACHSHFEVSSLGSSAPPP